MSVALIEVAVVDLEDDLRNWLELNACDIKVDILAEVLCDPGRGLILRIPLFEAEVRLKGRLGITEERQNVIGGFNVPTLHSVREIRAVANSRINERVDSIKSARLIHKGFTPQGTKTQAVPLVLRMDFIDMGHHVRKQFIAWTHSLFLATLARIDRTADEQAIC